jgi:hypothetical protein
LHLYARSYQPGCAAWLQSDPWEGKQDRPSSLNRYGYAENNPAAYTDLLGYMRPNDDGGPGSAPTFNGSGAGCPVNPNAPQCAGPATVPYCLQPAHYGSEKCGGPTPAQPAAQPYCADPSNNSSEKCGGPTPAADPQQAAQNSARYQVDDALFRKITGSVNACAIQHLEPMDVCLGYALQDDFHSRPSQVQQLLVLTLIAAYGAGSIGGAAANGAATVKRGLSEKQLDELLQTIARSSNQVKDKRGLLQLERPG